MRSKKLLTTACVLTLLTTAALAQTPAAPIGPSGNPPATGGASSSPCSAFGTTAGTCAQGNDSRITGAAPAASPTFTGTVTMPDSGTWGLGGINGSIIGGTTRAAGSFTTLAANGTANFTGTFQINSNTVTWPAAAISVARIDAAQTFNGTQTFQASGATGSNSSSVFTNGTATSSVEQLLHTNDTGNATSAFFVNNSATANTNLTNVPNSSVISGGGSSQSGLFIGTRSNSAPIIFFTGASTTGSKRGQIGGVSGGWCIGNCTTDNGAGTLVTTANLTVGGHALATGGAPAISSCGTSPGTPAGSDNFGSVVAGGGVLTSCVINFGTAWGAAPSCTVSSPTAIASLTVSTSTTQLTIGGTSLTGDTISWVCGSTS